jgi:hypothetical protein
MKAEDRDRAGRQKSQPVEERVDGVNEDKTKHSKIN